MAGLSALPFIRILYAVGQGKHKYDLNLVKGSYIVCAQTLSSRTRCNRDIR